MKLKKYGLKILLLLSSFFLIIFLVYFIRIKTAKVEIRLVKDLNIEFASKIKVSDLIESINGKILDDENIDTTKLGEQKIKFKFRNEENIKLTYKFKINIVDTVAPIIWLNSVYIVEKDSDIKLEDKILCGDNYDSRPNCYIKGKYDLGVVGDYNLIYKAIDSSKNKTEQKFTLKVINPVEETKEENFTEFSWVKDNYKTDKTLIGLDLSKWQNDVDFKKLKEAGVEFVMIRVGGTRGKSGKYFVDEKFKQNIKNAKKYGIKAGVYFYSYADSLKKAREEANWVLKQIKKYKIEMPIAFDWEEWGNFNEYKLSFFGLTSMAEEFIKVIESKGYQGMIYSSKSYLENIWMPTDYNIWLAHYTEHTNYEGKYKMWQICSNGKIDGVLGPVDIDIWYK